MKMHVDMCHTERDSGRTSWVLFFGFKKNNLVHRKPFNNLFLSVIVHDFCLSNSKKRTQLVLLESLSGNELQLQLCFCEANTSFYWSNT